MRSRTDEERACLLSSPASTGDASAGAVAASTPKLRTSTPCGEW
ncbi:MAG: hypothetical protein ABW208_21070 [Pyrinomonadaceae bacterium]